FTVTPDFAETTVVHSPAFGISFAPSQFGAVSWCTPGTLSTTDYSGITFWVNGGTGGGQNLELVIGLNGSSFAQAPLTTLLGAQTPVNSWVPLTPSCDSGPMQFSGNFDQISIQDNSGNDSGTPQPTVYFDDASLVARVSVVDEIFKNGFEAAAAGATSPIQI